MNQRLTRKEMKRDEVMEGLSRGVAFLQNNSKAIGVGAVAIVVLLVGLWGWKIVAGSREAKANLALSEALAGVSTEGGELATSKEALEGVVDRYGSTGPGAVANAYLGTIAARAGDYETARRHWDIFLAGGERHALAAGVERNLISLDRAEGKNEALAEKLRASLATGSSALGEDSILYELGRTLEELGQVEGAGEIYDRLLAEHPTSLFAAQARQRSTALEAS